jgi:DNA repair exonuclease SbcCD nuclease subunit
MDFSFIHAADLHLGSPFAGMASKDPILATRLASASREAMEELVLKAVENQVQFVIIAGDLYDQDWKDTSIGHFFNRQMARLERAGIPVYLLRGNHDADHVIVRASKMTLPANVKVFSSLKVDRFEIPELRVVLHGRSFAERATTENLASTYPVAEPGLFNIGVLHTSLDGREGHANYAPCTVTDLAQRGYHYWALGHVHGFEEITRDPYIVYPGNLQGRDVRECCAKGAVLVRVEGGEVAEVERLILDRIRWESLTADLTGFSTDEEIFAAVLASIHEAVTQTGSTPLVFRMTLHGSTSLHRKLLADLGAVAEEVMAAAGQVNEQTWLESVKIATSEPVLLHTPADTALAALDLAAMLDPLLSSEAVMVEVRAALGQIRNRLPAMNIPEETFSEAALDALMQEARATLLVGTGKTRA